MCPAPLQVDTDFEYRLQIGEDTVDNCGAPYSEDIFFSGDQIMFSCYWAGAWSLLCIIFTLFTLSSFLINISRFQYPERPIIYLTLCYSWSNMAPRHQQCQCRLLRQKMKLREKPQLMLKVVKKQKL